jgi:hypothetical protein
MGTFSTVEEMPTEGAIRGLTGEAAEEADKAIADGLVRTAPFNQETEKVVGAIKRYLSQQGWGCKVKSIGGKIHWQVVEKKEITPEHKAKMLEALGQARAKREAEKAKATEAESAKAATNGDAKAPKAPVQAQKGQTEAQAPAKAQEAKRGA